MQEVFFGQCFLYKLDSLALYVWSNFKFSSCINFRSFMCSILDTSQSQWSCSLRNVCMAAHLLGLWVWILLFYGCLSFVSVVCGLAEVSATGWSLIQSRPTDCGVSCVIKKPQEWGGQGPCWAAAPHKKERERERGRENKLFFSRKLSEPEDGRYRSKHVVLPC
jgi:hypothetical protein